MKIVTSLFAASLAAVLTIIICVVYFSKHPIEKIGGIKELDSLTVPNMNLGSGPFVPSKKKLIHNLILNSEQVVVLSGVIGEESTLGVAGAITKAASNDRPVFLLISSPGGSVMAGAQIVNAIEAAKVPVFTVCMDMCASMAAIIHQYGTKRLMQDRSILMFHDAAGMFQGYLPHMQSEMNMIIRFFTRFNVYIANRAKMSLAELEATEHTNLWIDSEDAIPRHLNDKLVYIQVVNNNQLVDVKSLFKRTELKSTTQMPEFVPPSFKFLEL